MDMPPREMPSQPARERLSRTTPRWIKIIGGVLAAGVVLLLVGVIVFVLTARIVIGSGHTKVESRTVSGFTSVDPVMSALDFKPPPDDESVSLPAHDNLF